MRIESTVNVAEHSPVWSEHTGSVLRSTMYDPCCLSLAWRVGDRRSNRDASTKITPPSGPSHNERANRPARVIGAWWSSQPRARKTGAIYDFLPRRHPLECHASFPPRPARARRTAQRFFSPGCRVTRLARSALAQISLPYTTGRAHLERVVLGVRELRLAGAEELQRRARDEPRAEPTARADGGGGSGGDGAR